MSEGWSVRPEHTHGRSTASDLSCKKPACVLARQGVDAAAAAALQQLSDAWPGATTCAPLPELGPGPARAPGPPPATPDARTGAAARGARHNGASTPTAVPEQAAGAPAAGGPAPTGSEPGATHARARKRIRRAGRAEEGFS